MKLTRAQERALLETPRERKARRLLEELGAAIVALDDAARAAMTAQRAAERAFQRRMRAWLKSNREKCGAK